MTIYRQIAHKLRWHRRSGGEVHSTRPREGSRAAGWGRYLDEAEPTLIEIGDDDLVSAESLLRIGAIAPHDPPQGGE